MTIIFQTKRLIAKAPSNADIENLYLLQSDPDVMKFIGKGNRRTDREVRESLEEIIRYYNKYGFSFFSIYEKGSGQFVGQGGLFHLNFDDTQPDIEVGYRLNKFFWNKGYATELAQGLIKWGFENLEVKTLVAVINPSNNRSRKVLQKVGMKYKGTAKYNNFPVHRFEIAKNVFDYTKITLTAASLNEYTIIQNMARFYVYDISEYLGSEVGWELPEDGLYECIDFKKYWETEDAFPFLIRYENELAGFVIVDKKGSHSLIDFNMAQFFILRKFKGQGIGRYVAYHCFNQFLGNWEVMVIPGNEGAYRFWRTIISDYTQGDFIEYTKTIPHLENSIKNIFNFISCYNELKHK